MRISFDEMYNEFLRIFLKTGFSQERAELSAKLFTETSLDGVQSHSVLRIDFFLDYIAKGFVKIDAEPSLIESTGPFERWDGNLGPGNLNAKFATDRACDIADKQGMACVAMRNTNHWMRGGTYGWQAADRGCIAVIFTNTIPNMPPWGSLSRRVGNNPLVIAVPRNDGHVVLDMAMSQFSYGKFQSHALNDEKLPFPGGYDSEGELTDDAAEIMKSGLPLPMGYWKGSGLAIMINLMTAILSQGNADHDLLKARDEHGPSQVFMAFSLKRLGGEDFARSIADEIIDFIHSGEPAREGGSVCYPGERTIATRMDNLKNGIPVNNNVWDKIKGM